MGTIKVEWSADAELIDPAPSQRKVYGQIIRARSIKVNGTAVTPKAGTTTAQHSFTVAQWATMLPRLAALDKSHTVTLDVAPRGRKAKVGRSFAQVAALARKPKPSAQPRKVAAPAPVQPTE